jgi:DNA-binding transcriptional ArsR family regulator
VTPRRDEITGEELAFEDAASLLKSLGHPLRLRLICGLCREPRTLTRIVSVLGAPLSTVALHLGVLRRAGVLEEERQGAEVVFRMRDDRVRGVLGVLCHPDANRSAPESWAWRRLAREMKKEPR